MFLKRRIKYFKIEKDLLGERLMIKYFGKEKEILTREKVDLEDWFEKQKPYYKKAIEEMKEKAKGWKKRHQMYLRFYENKKY